MTISMLIPIPLSALAILTRASAAALDKLKENKLKKQRCKKHISVSHYFKGRFIIKVSSAYSQKEKRLNNPQKSLV